SPTHVGMVRSGPRNLLPTHVGMDLVPERCRENLQRLPHACGDLRLGGFVSVPGSREQWEGSAVPSALLLLFLCVLCRSGLPLPPLSPTDHHSRATGFVLPVRGSAVFWW